MPSVDSDRGQIRNLQDEIVDPSEASVYDVDDIFDVLRNRRRRCILRYLIDVGGEADFRDLVEFVTAWEEGVPIEEITYDQRKRVYIALHQTHIPKLDDLGIIDHDHSGIVRLTDEIRDLQPFLDLVDRTRAEGNDHETEIDDREAADPGDDPVDEPTTTQEVIGGTTWMPSLAVGLAGLVVAGLAAIGIAPFAWVPGVAYALAVSVAAIGLGLYGYRREETAT